MSGWAKFEKPAYLPTNFSPPEVWITQSRSPLSQAQVASTGSAKATMRPMTGDAEVVQLLDGGLEVDPAVGLVGPHQLGHLHARCRSRRSRSRPSGRAARR
jgi:hypothetical protein